MICYVRAPKNPNVVILHCTILNREALVSKALPAHLHPVMSQVFKWYKLHKTTISSKSTFPNLCEAMDSEYKSLLYYSYAEVRCLSKRKVLKRMCQLKPEFLS